MSFPPTGPTTVLQTIPSYLYEEYNDDEDLQAFVNTQNAFTQEYIDWFNALNLPIYTQPIIAGKLLDWVAEGIYGMPRPALPSGTNRNIGAFNTYAFNTNAFNGRRVIGPQDFFATSDDVYKRILTWHFYKGDGKLFNIRWLKRRIMRFLIGVGGTAPNIDNTDQISVSFGAGNQVNIRIVSGIRTQLRGSIFNTSVFNGAGFNMLRSAFTPLVIPALAPTLKAAIDAGVLELPFQFNYVVIIENSPTDLGLLDVAGDLTVLSSIGWPTSATGLSPGALWNNSGLVTVVPGVVPNPLADPILYGTISAQALLTLGGGDLPTSAPTAGSNRLWNDSNQVKVA